MPIPAGGLIYAGRDEPTYDIKVEAAFGADLTADPGTWSWTDLSSRLRAEPIRIRAGGSGGPVTPGTCSVTLDNDDGALTPVHPMSPYWPNVGLGTPLQVRLCLIEDTFARTASGGWGVSDSDRAWSVAVGPAGDQAVSGGRAHQSHPTVNVLRRSVLAASLVDCEQVIDVSTSALLTGAALVTGMVFRETAGQNYYWLRAEFNAGGTSVMLKISKCVNSGFTDLATLNPVPGLAYAANTPLRVRASVVGTRLAIKVWPAAGAEPAGWQLTATDGTHSTAGAVGIQSWLVLGNTNALPVVASFDSYAVRVDRFSGFADQWEPTFIPIRAGESASAVRVTASGLLRRLSQGTPPSRSPLRRTIGASGPVAYWSVEDGALAGQAASALPGHSPLTVSGSVAFTSVEDYQFGIKVTFGTSALADLKGGGRLQAPLPGSATTATATAWTVHAVADADPSKMSGDMALLEWLTPGSSYVRWQLQVTKADSRVKVIAWDAADTAWFIVELPVLPVGLVNYAVTSVQSGPNIITTVRAGDLSNTNAGAAGTLKGITSITANATGTTSTVSVPVGHIAVWPTSSVPIRITATNDTYGGPVGGAWVSWVLEAATDRLARLCAEDGVTLDMPAVDGDSVQRMGSQPAGMPLDLYQECADVDGGILYERGFGLGYIPRQYRYNKPVDMTVDLATYAVTSGSQNDVLKPVYDDQRIRNQLTVERRDGSSVVVVDKASQQRSGVYGDSVELNLADDGQLADQAAWRLHVAGGEVS